MRKTWPLTDIYPSYPLPNPRPPWNVACHTKIRCKTNEQTKWRIEIWPEQAANSRQWSGNLGETVFLLLAFQYWPLSDFSLAGYKPRHIKNISYMKACKGMRAQKGESKIYQETDGGAAECSSFRFSVRRTPWVALVCYRLKVDPERSEFNFCLAFLRRILSRVCRRQYQQLQKM